MKTPDKITLERIKTAHPNIRTELEAQYIECNNLLPANCTLRFAFVYRSPQEQDALFNKRPKVTNARGWQSIHNYGLAFDIVLIVDGKAVWTVNKEWKQVADYFKSKGWEWGGDWKSFKDAPHFQKAFGLTWQQMKARIDSGKFTVENNIKYITL